MFSAPVFRSLLAPKLIFGLPYELGMIILMASLLFVMMLGYWLIGPIVIVIVALRFAINVDPFLLRLYQQYRREGDVYLPVITRQLRQQPRALSCGRGMLC